MTMPEPSADDWLRASRLVLNWFDRRPKQKPILRKIFDELYQAEHRSLPPAVLQQRVRANSLDALKNDVSRLREELDKLAQSCEGRSSVWATEIPDKNPGKTEQSKPYSLELRFHLDAAQRFWRPCFGDPMVVEVVYNEVLFFRDYTGRIIIRDDRFNDWTGALQLPSNVVNVQQYLGSIGNAGELRPAPYLLVGEIESRDRLLNWFSRQCKPVDRHDPDDEQRDPKLGTLLLRSSPSRRYVASTNIWELRDRHLIWPRKIQSVN